MRLLSIFLCAISTVFSQSSIEWNFAGWSTDQLKYESNDKLATGRLQEVPEFSEHYISIKNGNFFQVDNAPRGFLTEQITLETVVRITEIPQVQVAGLFGFGDTVTRQGLFLGYWGKPKQFINLSFFGTTELSLTQKQRPVVVGEWLHIIARCSHNLAEYYINGQLLSRKKLTNHKIIYPSHNVMAIGSYYSPNNEAPFPVSADFHMFKIYNFPLTDAEMKQRIEWGQKLIASDFKTAKPILKPKAKKADKQSSNMKNTFRILAVIFLVLGIFFVVLNKIVRNVQAAKEAET